MATHKIQNLFYGIAPGFSQGNTGQYTPRAFAQSQLNIEECLNSQRALRKPLCSLRLADLNAEIAETDAELAEVQEISDPE